MATKRKKPVRTRGLSAAEIEFCESMSGEYSGDVLAKTVENWADLEVSPIDELRATLEMIRESLDNIEGSIDELSQAYDSEGYPAPEAPEACPECGCTPGGGYTEGCPACDALSGIVY